MHVAVSNMRATTGKIPAPIDGTEEAKIASDKLWYAFNHSFQNREITPDEFMRLVLSGHAFTAQHRDNRHKKNFIRGQHIALDMDNAGMSLSQVAEMPFFRRYAYFAYTTPSHTEENPRLRVVFILDRPISDASKYGELAAALIGRFGGAVDSTGKDPARFFYGSLGALHHCWGNIMTLEEAANELVFPDRKLQEAVRRTMADAAASRIQLPPSSVSTGLLRSHAEKLLGRVRQAPDGEKHVTLRNISVVFGGYVATGHYRLDDVRSWLQAAIAANPNNVKSLDAANECIEGALQYGMARPLHFEVAPSASPEPDYPELEKVHPPLTPQQRIAVVRIIADREWKAYHDGMTGQERELWWGKGIDDVVIDMLSLGIKHDINEETGEIADVMTVPYFRGGEIVNVEYRGRGGTSYANDRVSLYYPEESEHNTPLLVFPDSISSIQWWLHIGHKFRVAGLPEMVVEASTFSGADDYVFVMEPDTDISGRGLSKVKDRIKFLRMPMPMPRMIAAGFDADKMFGYIRNARMA